MWASAGSPPGSAGPGDTARGTSVRVVTSHKMVSDSRDEPSEDQARSPA